MVSRKNLPPMRDSASYERNDPHHRAPPPAPPTPTTPVRTTCRTALRSNTVRDAMLR